MVHFLDCLLALSDTPNSRLTRILETQAQLEGTENRIATERKRFNDTARQYNTEIRKFPGSLIASISGFDRKAYFEANEGAEKPPLVDFE